MKYLTSLAVRALLAFALLALPFSGIARAADLSITAASVVADSNATTESGYLGATITAGQVVYKDTADNRWKLADNNGASALIRTPTGIALNGGGSGQPVRVLRSGDITIGATMTAGVAYYLSGTAGGIAPVADLGSGMYPSVIGIATSTTVLRVSFISSGVAL
jgi:hypothetical protein